MPEIQEMAMLCKRILQLLIRRTWPSLSPYLCKLVATLVHFSCFPVFLSDVFWYFFWRGVCCISQTTFLALPPFPRRLFMVEHGGNSNARQSHGSAPHQRCASVRVVEFQYHLTIRRKTPGGVLMGVDGWKTPLQILFKYNTYGVCDIKHLHGKMKKLNGNLV